MKHLFTILLIAASTHANAVQYYPLMVSETDALPVSSSFVSANGLATTTAALGIAQSVSATAAIPIASASTFMPATVSSLTLSGSHSSLLIGDWESDWGTATIGHALFVGGGVYDTALTVRGDATIANGLTADTITASTLSALAINANDIDAGNGTITADTIHATAIATLSEAHAWAVYTDTVSANYAIEAGTLAADGDGSLRVYGDATVSHTLTAQTVSASTLTAQTVSATEFSGTAFHNAMQNEMSTGAYHSLPGALMGSASNATVYAYNNNGKALSITPSNSSPESYALAFVPVQGFLCGNFTSRFYFTRNISVMWNVYGVKPIGNMDIIVGVGNPQAAVISANTPTQSSAVYARISSVSATQCAAQLYARYWDGTQTLTTTLCNPLNPPSVTVSTYCTPITFTTSQHRNMLTQRVGVRLNDNKFTLYYGRYGTTLLELMTGVLPSPIKNEYGEEGSTPNGGFFYGAYRSATDSESTLTYVIDAAIVEE